MNNKVTIEVANNGYIVTQTMEGSDDFVYVYTNVVEALEKAASHICYEQVDIAARASEGKSGSGNG